MHTPHNPSRTTVVTQRNLALVVLTGSVLFGLLYVVAARLYPGGSTADPNEAGFNVFTNYWCDLLGNHAKNGQLNPGQPFAMTAMVVLCLTLAYFFYATPGLLGYAKATQRLLQAAGVLSMVVAPFIFTVYHDTVINVAGTFGVLTMLGTFTGLYRYGYVALLRLGLVCLVLCGLNNYIYHTHHFIEYLPIVQKFSFFLFLLWFNWVSLTLRRNAFIHE